MRSELLREPRDPRGGWWTVLAAFIVLVVMVLMLSGCSPRIVERLVVQKDTTYITRTDSVKFYDRDSIFVREKGDTVYKYVEKWRWRDRVKIDTVLRVKVDSVTVERVKEVKVEKPLSWWQRFRIGAFWLLSLALAGCLVWIFRKPLLKLLMV